MQRAAAGEAPLLSPTEAAGTSAERGCITLFTEGISRNRRFLEEDRNFIAVVDGHFADAASRSGSHLLCHPGCAQCCTGVFAIGPADSLRVRQGMTALMRDDPARAARVQSRAGISWTKLADQFPGDPTSGILAVDKDGELLKAFQFFGDDEICPVLDPENGTCDLYSARPHTCRVFGPPVATPEGYGVCELCFQKATPQEVAAAAITSQSAATTDALDRLAIAAGVQPGDTILAFCLRSA